MSRRTQWFAAAVVILTAASAFQSFDAGAAPIRANWSSWRGSEGTGVSTETNVPVEWGADKNIRWKAPIPGRGHSSPIVWGDRIFLTTDVEGDIAPGAAPVKHKLEGQDFVHPDSVGGNRTHTFKTLCLDRAHHRRARA